MSFKKSTKYGAAIVTLATIGFGYVFTSPTHATGHDAGPSSVQSAEVVVYKTASCGCCRDWVSHLERSELRIEVVNVSSTSPTRDQQGVPHRLGSCHTAVVGDYWVEGHVPADLVRRPMKERPGNIEGIAVPGMPMGSPGMEGPNPVTYDVIAYHSDGSTSVYATRQGSETVH
jgi:hypothetical protein